MSTDADKAWERFKTNMGAAWPKWAASAEAPPKTAGPVGSLRCDALVLFPVGSVQGAIDRLEDAARIANSVGAFLYAEAFIGVANKLRADMARATVRQPEENDAHQPTRRTDAS